ncbi:ABC transporter permease [Nocardioides insulae]|uniref:ABC transporter permease n=1 Tax=Nocardioides insulae TaxID=394734 RepID=UPI0003F7E1E3|nr:ABC transporter permease [Nocardioides insulae]
MLWFVARRVAQAVPMLLSVILLIFVLMQFTPGDPVQAMVGQYPVPQSFRDSLTAEYHLNAPVWTQYWYFLVNLAHGNMGYSYASHESVTSLIAERLPNTLLLAGSGYIVGIVLGGVVGLITATTKRRGFDTLMQTGVVTAYAIPSFWLGQLLVMLFAVHLGWFPTQGMAPVDSNATGIYWFLERLSYLILPMLTYAVYEGARVTRLTRVSVIDTLNQGYIVTARMKGLSRWQTVRSHVIRNSSLPVVTALGYSFAVAMGGSVLIETVFSWPGIGLLLVDSIKQRDNQVVIGLVVVIAVAVIVMNLLVDMAHALLDPRIRA